MEALKKLTLLAVFVLMNQACSSVSQTPETAEIRDPSRTSPPTTLQTEINIPGADVVDAKLKFRDIPLELTLHKVRKDVWQAELNDEQLSLLSAGQFSQVYSATLDIRAEDERGRPRNLKRAIIVEYPQTVG